MMALLGERVLMGWDGLMSNMNVKIRSENKRRERKSGFDDGTGKTSSMLIFNKIGT